MRTLRITGLVVLLSLFGTTARAQADGPTPSSLMNDLCGCMGAIDLRAGDRTVEQGVRDCLEEAVLRYPSEVYAVLQHTPEGGSKAFRLGTALGGHLLRVCEPFHAVKARLQQMSLRKQGT